MKKILQTLVLALSAGILPAQNYIQNGDLETGPGVTAPLEITYATGWTITTCPTTSYSVADLFDVSSTNCQVGIPVNKWAYNVPVRAAGHRYLGLSGSSTGIAATLSALPATCYNYNLQFWVRTVDALSTNVQPNPCQPSYAAPYYTSRVQVTLYNSSNCSSLLVYDSPDIQQSGSWQSLATSFTLTPAQAAAGYNRVQFKIVRPRGAIPAPYTEGQILFMDDFSLTGNTDLTPAVTVNGAPTLCSGNAITAVGTFTGTSTPTYYDWAIAECYANGSLVTGGYAADNWYAGVPSGTYSYPNSASLACGKYYKIRFITVNGCVIWAEADQVIYLACSPAPVITGTATVCSNVSDQLCVNYAPAKFVYDLSWSPVSAATQCITVNPTTTTTYSVTVFDDRTGCKNTATYTVNVLPNDPTFLPSVTNLSTQYYNMQFAPHDLGAASQPGFGYEWIIDIMDNTFTNVLQTFNGAYPCTWNYPNPTIFIGFDGTASPIQAPCTSGGPNPGRFQYGVNYRVTRATWNNNCTWNPVSFKFNYSKPPLANKGTGTFTLERTYDTPDISQSAFFQKPQMESPQLSVYPNPGIGMFKVTLKNGMDGMLEVYDVMGKRMKTLAVQSGVSEYDLDLTEMPKGMYLINLISEGKQYQQKLIVQ